MNRLQMQSRMRCFDFIEQEHLFDLKAGYRLGCTGS